MSSPSFLWHFISPVILQWAYDPQWSDRQKEMCMITYTYQNIIPYLENSGRINKSSMTKFFCYQTYSSAIFRPHKPTGRGQYCHSLGTMSDGNALSSLYHSMGHNRTSQVMLVVKNLPSKARDSRDTDSIPGLGRSPAGGSGNLFFFSCLRNSVDRGAWEATVHGVKKSLTWLNDWEHEL